jgi:hypothetical protein
MSVMTGDLMGQFEILKLFHSISGLSRLFVLYFQITLFLVFTTGFSGSFFVALFPDVTWVQLWGLNGPFVSLIVLALFYLWFQGFLTTKLYQSMLISVEIEVELIKERKCKYCRLMKEYSLLGFFFLIGLGFWIWGMTSFAESKWELMVIRIGESVAQVHIACSSLFVKHIKEFKFPVEKKNTDTKTTVKVRDLVSKKNFMSYQNTPTVRLQPGDSEIMLKLTRNSLSQGGS